jgi:hypothetical protein
MTYDPNDNMKGYRERAEQLRNIAAELGREDYQKAILDVACEYDRIATAHEKTEALVQLFKRSTSDRATLPGVQTASSSFGYGGGR